MNAFILLLNFSVLTNAVKVHRGASNVLPPRIAREIEGADGHGDAQSRVNYTWYRSIVFKRNMSLSLARRGSPVSQFFSARTRTRSSFPSPLAKSPIVDSLVSCVEVKYVKFRKWNYTIYLIKLHKIIVWTKWLWILLQAETLYNTTRLFRSRISYHFPSNIFSSSFFGTLFSNKERMFPSFISWMRYEITRQIRNVACAMIIQMVHDNSASCNIYRLNAIIITAT